MSDSKTEGGSAQSPSVPRAMTPEERELRRGLACLHVEVAAPIANGMDRLAAAALAAAEAAGRAAALEEAADECRALADEADPSAHRSYWTAYQRIRALINQGRDEVAPSPEIPAESTDPEAK